MALYVGVDPLPELVERHARPVPAVEHLGLHGAEEALHPGVVRRAALSRRRSGYAGLLADAYPLRPAVVAAAVRVDHEVAALMVRGRVERGPGHGVGHLGVRRRRGRPAHDGAVEAVEHRREAELPRGYRELRHVGEPQEVGKPRLEVLPDLVAGMLRDLPLVGAVAPLRLRLPARLQPLLGHYPPYPALADDVALRLELVVDAAPPVGAVVGVEDGADHLPRLGVPVRGPHRLELVLVARAGHAEGAEELREPPLRPQGLNEQRLLPVRELVCRVGARPFSQELQGALHHVAPDLEPAELLHQLPLPRLEGVYVGLRRPDGLPVPVARDLPCAPGPPDERRHGALLLLEGEGPGLGRPALARRQLFDPVGKLLVALGVPQLAPRAGVAAAVLQVVVDGGPLLLRRVRLGGPAPLVERAPGLEPFPVPGCELDAGWIAQLPYRRRRLEAVLDVEPDRPGPLFKGVHAILQASSFGTDFRYHPHLIHNLPLFPNILRELHSEIPQGQHQLENPLMLGNDHFLRWS